MNNKNTTCLFRIDKHLLLLFLLFLVTRQVYSQYKIHYDTDYPATLTFGPERNNGFRISVSLVALFTSGSADRNGVRLGAGVTLSQTVDNWIFITGLDAYKAKQHLGIGTSYAGIVFDDGRFGTSYYLNKYYQGNSQMSGILGIHIKDFQVRFEDDVLSYPFSGFKVYDRYRTAALELRYKGFLIGTNVYTTGINGLTSASVENNKGVYLTGKQISSPIYLGYTTNDLILRCGINNKTGGLIGQNSWHQHFFQTPDFNYGNYNNPFIQIGIDKPYTLY